MARITEWKTKNDGVVLIKDMTTSHLKNTINMFVRNIGDLRITVIGNAYAFQGTCRGDAACDAMEGEIYRLDMIEDEDLLSENNPTFKALYKEWKSRV